MAYISQDEKKHIAPVIKALLKEYGLKGSLSIDDHTTIKLTIKEGKLDFIGNYNETLSKKDYTGRVQRVKDSMSVNPYWFQEQFTGDMLAFLTKAFSALKGKGWFDHSDSQTDYFHTKHYVEISIGKWDTPYKLETK